MGNAHIFLYGVGSVVASAAGNSGFIIWYEIKYSGYA